MGVSFGADRGANDAPIHIMQLVSAFGGKAGFDRAVHDLQDAMYQEAG
jgi:hypothetical protein